MLKLLSYINIALAIIYFVLYLLNSNSYAMAGIFSVIIFNVFVIRTTERELKFGAVHVFLLLPVLVFAAFLGIWTCNIISSSLEHNYFANSWLYILISTSFVMSIAIQTLLMWLYHRHSTIRPM